MQSYSMAGIFLQDFFVLKIRLQDIFSEITYTTPLPRPPPRSGLKRPLHVTRDLSSEREFRCSLHVSVLLWE